MDDNNTIKQGAPHIWDMMLVPPTSTWAFQNCEPSIWKSKRCQKMTLGRPFRTKLGMMIKFSMIFRETLFRILWVFNDVINWWRQNCWRHQWSQTPSFDVIKWPHVSKTGKNRPISLPRKYATSLQVWSHLEELNLFKYLIFNLKLKKHHEHCRKVNLLYENLKNAKKWRLVSHLGQNLESWSSFVCFFGKPSFPSSGSSITS